MKAVDSTFLIAWLTGDEATHESVKRLRLGGGIATTEINTYEVFKGVFRGPREKARARALQFESLLSRIHILAYDREAARLAGQIHAELEMDGQEVDDLDVMIGATCLSSQIPTIVTRNRKHFERIPGLKVEEH